jgi:hypothetical protein
MRLRDIADIGEIAGDVEIADAYRRRLATARDQAI